MQIVRTTVVAALALCGCAPTEPSTISTVFALENVRVARGTEITVSPRYAFSAESCSASRDEFDVNVGPSVLSDPRAFEVLDVEVSATRNPNPPGECWVDVHVHMKAVAVGHSQFYVEWSREPAFVFAPLVAGSLEVAEADHFVVNLMGLPALSLVEGAVGLVQATLADAQDRSLLGDEITLAAPTSGVVAIERFAFAPNAWTVLGLVPGSVPYTLANGTRSLTAMATVVAATDLDTLGLFRAEARPRMRISGEDLEPIERFTLARIGAPIGLAHDDDAVTILATPIDGSGAPVYSGPGVGYTVQSFPVVTATPHSMELTFPAGAAQTAWISVAPHAAGSAEVLASWQALSATTSVVVSQ